MADIQKLTYPYFTDGTTQLNAANLNPIIAKLNEVIDKVNDGSTPVQQTVATPVINISGNTATITCATSGATIKYTTDGSTPSASNGSTYSSAITLSTSCTIKAIAIKNGMTNSQVASQSYTPATVATPVITVNDGVVTITCATSGAVIHYTTDGNTPSASSTTYSAAFTPASSVTQIKAIAVKSGMTNSSVATQAYTPASIPTQAETTAILNRYSKQLTSQQSNAFNTFIYNIKNAGIYSKIKYLVLPILASDKTEATQNALDGTSAFSDTLGVGSITFANNGIKPTVGEAVTAYKVTDNDTVLRSNDFHFSAFNNDSAEAYSTQDVVFGALPISVGKSYNSGTNPGVSFQDSNNDTKTCGYPVGTNSVRYSEKTHFVGSTSSASQVFALKGAADSESSVFTNSKTTADKAMNTLRAPRFGCDISITTTYPADGENDKKGTTHFNYGFLSWGLALNEQQCTSFNTYVQALMSAFIA